MICGSMIRSGLIEAAIRLGFWVMSRAHLTLLPSSLRTVIVARRGQTVPSYPIARQRALVYCVACIQPLISSLCGIRPDDLTTSSITSAGVVVTL